MIRINLLHADASTRGTLTPEKPNITIWALVLFCGTAVGMSWWWWQLTTNVSGKQEQVEQLERETTRLAEVQKQVTQFEQQKKLLEERISLIERLKSNQTGPVTLLDTVINSIPDRPTIWLTDLNQKGTTVTLDGRSFDVPSIADFIAGLSRSSLFKSVELAYWQEEEPAIKFQLNCVTR